MHTGPSWADRSSGNNPARRPASPRGVGRAAHAAWETWVVIVISMALALLPLVLAPRLPLYGERERSALIVLLVMWPVAVILATIVVLRRWLPAADPVFSDPPSRRERFLNAIFGFVGLLTVYELVLRRRPLPVGVWLACVLLVAVATLFVLRGLSRDRRRRLSTAIYGGAIGLIVLFPTAAMSRRFQFVVSLAATILILIMTVLLIHNTTGRRNASASE